MLATALAFGDPINDALDALPVVDELLPETKTVDPPKSEEKPDVNEDREKMIEIYQGKMKTIEDYAMDESYGATWSLPSSDDVNLFASKADFTGTSGTMNTFIRLMYFKEKIEYLKLFAEVYDGRYKDRYVTFLAHISPDAEHFEYDEKNPLHYKAKNITLEIRPGSF